MSQQLVDYFKHQLPTINTRQALLALKHDIAPNLVNGLQVAEIRHCLIVAIKEATEVLFHRPPLPFKLEDYRFECAPDLMTLFLFYEMLREGHLVCSQVINMGVDNAMLEYYHHFVETKQIGTASDVNKEWSYIQWDCEDIDVLRFKTLLLLGNGGNVNHLDEFNRRPLAYAIASAEDYYIVRMLLLSPDIDLDCVALSLSGIWDSAYEVAISNNRADILRLLLQHPQTNLQATANQNLFLGEFLLLFAVHCNRPYHALMLLDFGATVGVDHREMFGNLLQQRITIDPDAWTPILDRLNGMQQQAEVLDASVVPHAMWQNPEDADDVEDNNDDAGELLLTAPN